jgi:hypothetical protein
MGGQRHAPALFTHGKESRYPLHRWQGGHQGRSGRVRRIFSSPGFDPPTVQLIAMRHTDYVIVLRLAWKMVGHTCEGAGFRGKVELQ